MSPSSSILFLGIARRARLPTTSPTQLAEIPLPFPVNKLVWNSNQHSLQPPKWELSWMRESMAPTDAILDQYRKDKSWETYETAFKQLLDERNLIEQLDLGWWTTNKA